MNKRHCRKHCSHSRGLSGSVPIAMHACALKDLRNASDVGRTATFFHGRPQYRQKSSYGAVSSTLTDQLPPITFWPHHFSTQHLQEFDHWLADKAACRSYVFRVRWPEGISVLSFQSAVLDYFAAWSSANAWLWQRPDGLGLLAWSDQAASGPTDWSGWMKHTLLVRRNGKRGCGT